MSMNRVIAICLSLRKVMSDIPHFLQKVVTEIKIFTILKFTFRICRSEMQSGCNLNFSTFVPVMKTISRITMCLAAVIVLLMSAVPHHHHCSNLETTHHIDYICFADDDYADDDCDGTCPCYEEHSLDTHKHCESQCHLHLVVTLLSQIQSIPQLQSIASMIDNAFVWDSSKNPNLSCEQLVPLSERLLSYYLVQSKGLRAPPVK